MAKQSGAEVLLRIDDMDRERKEPEYVNDIFETLKFLNITWSQGPVDANNFERRFSQLSRIANYEALLDRIVATGRVYACRCSRNSLAKSGGMCECKHRKVNLQEAGVAWRLDTDGLGEMQIQTPAGAIGKVFPDEMRNFVVRKRDGFPAYQVCSLADDVFFGVDLIVRGEDLWPSTLAQLYLAQLAGETQFLNASFHHHGLLKNPKGEKLSKSNGDISVRYWREHGKTREELLEMIRRLSGDDSIR